jgi:precorrin-2 dehydrogenase / sirohydrochlorin ferrochelatase
MAPYPVSLCIQDRLCIVVGAGDVALRKVESLRNAGARVKVIAPEETGMEGIELIKRPFRPGDLEGAFLVVAATNDREVNEQVYHEAMAAHILVNVVDNPPLCTFYVPSVVTRGDLQISVSTGGKCPALARKIRQEIEALYGPEYEAYLRIVEEARQGIIARYDPALRKDMMNRVLEDVTLREYVWQGRLEEARDRIGDRLPY